MADAGDSTSLERVAEVQARASNALGKVLGSVLDVGRDILARRGLAPVEQHSPAGLVKACQELLEHRGEASGLALASRIGESYLALDADEQLAFFKEKTDHLYSFWDEGKIPEEVFTRPPIGGDR